MQQREYSDGIEIDEASNTVTQAIKLELVDVRVDTLEDFYILVGALLSELSNVLHTVKVYLGLVSVAIESTEECPPIVEFVLKDHQFVHVFIDHHFLMAIVSNAVLVNTLLVYEVNVASTHEDVLSNLNILHVWL